MCSEKERRCTCPFLKSESFAQQKKLILLRSLAGSEWVCGSSLRRGSTVRGNHILLTSGFHGERQPAEQALFLGERSTKRAWSLIWREARDTAPYPASRVSDALACFRSPERRKKIEPVLQARWKYSEGTYVIMITAPVKMWFFLLLTTVDCNWSSSAWIHMIFKHPNKISI